MHFAPFPYLDPGAGSLLIQLIICGICASPFAAIMAIIALIRSHGKGPQGKTSSTEEK